MWQREKWYSFKLEGTAITEEAVLFSMKQNGMIKSHTIINDISDNMIAVVITEKMGMASVTNFICKPMPTFDGQAPLTSDELKKAGIDESTTNFPKLIPNVDYLVVHRHIA